MRLRGPLVVILLRCPGLSPLGQAQSFSLQPQLPPLSFSPWQKRRRPKKKRRPNGLSSSASAITNPCCGRSSCGGCRCLHMALVPLTVDEVSDLISVDTTPTASQYAAYWGRTPRERYNRLVGTLLVSILGSIFSYCLSFILGGFVATLLGAIFLFWGVFTPQLQARQRNWEFLGGRPLVDQQTQEEDWFPLRGSGGDDYYNDNNNDRRGLYGALFLGTLQDVCVVEYAAAPAQEEFDLQPDFDDYTMETDDLERYTGNPYLLRVRLRDEQGRQLQVHARLSEEYLDLQAGQAVVALLLSTSTQFDQLAALSDVFVPSVQTYVGDYPYLHRDGVENLLALDDEIWNMLQDEEEEAAAVSSHGGATDKDDDKTSPNWDYRGEHDDDDRQRTDSRNASSPAAGNWKPSNRADDDDNNISRQGPFPSSQPSEQDPPVVPVRRRRKGRPREEEDLYD